MRALLLALALTSGTVVGCVTDVVADEAGAVVCTGELTACDGVCVELHESHDHCGDCDVACAEQEFCHDGDCVCRAGLRRCGDVCVDLDTDLQHCGQCDQACGADQNCVARACVPA
jgi:hypothetical protein